MKNDGDFATQNEFMRVALEEAKVAAENGEVPIGAVVVRGGEDGGGEIIARAHNMRESAKNALAHAEIMAIFEACERLGRWRLDDCDLYVTLEPCQMCMGAARNGRIRRVVFGAAAENPSLNHEFEVEGGVLEDECSEILREFFRERRV